MLVGGSVIGLGLLVWGLYGVYKLVGSPPDRPTATGTATTTE